MRFTFAPHIESRMDGQAYVCSLCGARETFPAVILVGKYLQRVKAFAQRHTDCQAAVQRAATAALRAKAREIGKAIRARTPRAEKTTPPRRWTLDELLVDTVKQIAPEAEGGRVRLGFLTERYNARAREHGQVVIKASQVAARLRKRGLRISAFEREAQGGKGKCLLVDNKPFREFAAGERG